ncbi:response regulator [Candidatus Aerophobetes bacterium]|nr:response regulator [Candidatus Aerophobetes bacterium]
MAKRKESVLVIDDDSQMVEFVRRVLEAHSYQVHSAPSAEKGLKKVKELSPDLIILDVMLETKGEGFWTAQKLKSTDAHSEYRAYSHIPILMLTAINSEMKLRYSPETDGEYLPAEDFVEKPVEPSELVRKVKNLLTPPKPR